MKQWKRPIALLLLLCLVFVLSACGGKKGPTAKDAEDYVKAVLDLMCTGDYDHSVNLADADEIGATIEASVDEALEAILADMSLNDDIVADFRQVLISMFSKVRYTVGTATAAEEGFDVPVTIEPILFGDKVTEAVNEGVAEITSDPNVATMTEDEMINKLMRYAVDALKAELDDPQYGESSVVTVRYKELQDGLYGVDEADGQKLGMAMFQAA